jgi:anti-sigma B factor antagonist
MEYSLFETNGHLVVKIKDDIDTYNVNDFRNVMFDLMETEPKSLVFDMQEVGFADSSAISALIALKRRAQKHGGDFALLNVPDNFFDILRLATLHSFFTFYEDYETLPKV